MLCQPTHWRSEMPWMLLFEFWTNTCVPRVDLRYPLKNLKEVKLWSTKWPILVTPASRLLGVWRLLERYSRVSFPPGGSLTNFPCVLVTGRDHVRHMHPGRPVHGRLSVFGCRGSSIWRGYTCWQAGWPVWTSLEFMLLEDSTCVHVPCDEPAGSCDGY